MHNVGIVGVGFVGGSFAAVLENMGFGVKRYDKFKDSDTLESVVKESELIFVCVPTPMKKDGSCDISYVNDVAESISPFVQTKKTLLLKSTVPPGTTEDLAKKWKQYDWIFNPEFLTERFAVQDVENQKFVILGKTDLCSDVEFKRSKSFYDVFCKKQQEYYDQFAKVVLTKANIAEMVKYTTNSYFSTKVMFFNIVKEVCDSLNISYNEFKTVLNLDERIFPMHQDVPGHDGKLGFGGACFPKDLNGFISFAKSCGVDVRMLEEVWARNLRIRESQDWKDIKGAVSDE